MFEVVDATRADVVDVGVVAGIDVLVAQKVTNSLPSLTLICEERRISV